MLCTKWRVTTVTEVIGEIAEHVSEVVRLTLSRIKLVFDGNLSTGWQVNARPRLVTERFAGYFLYISRAGPPICQV